MPQFDFPYPRRYNTLRLLGYDYNSTWQLCAISLVTDLRRPLFADLDLAKSILKSLLSDQTLQHMRVRAFTLMPDHFHCLAGLRDMKRICRTLLACSRVTRRSCIGSGVEKSFKAVEYHFHPHTSQSQALSNLVH